MTHEQWQRQVTDALGMFGWCWMHARRSIGKAGKWTTAVNIVGWPDLLCWHPTRGLLAIELKVKPDRLRAAQRDVLASLRQAGVQTLVAYPEGAQSLVDALSRPRSNPLCKQCCGRVQK